MGRNRRLFALQFSAVLFLLELSCTLEIYDQSGGAGRCGDGVLQLGEVCDDGNTASGDGCSADCRSLEICGNGLVDVAAGERCDDRGESAMCNANCTLALCGDGIVNIAAGEQCDAGTLNGTPGVNCSANCRSLARCGNGIIDVAAGEVCDDGNRVSGDGCSADCRSLEICGNGIVDTAAGEQCDTGGGPSATCNVNCTVSRCGDGILNVLAGEVCDDGNTINGDGCESNCTPTP